MLQDFTAIVSGSSIVLDWEIITGNTCNGIKIFRSDDDLNWEEIGDIPGICGSISEPIPYQWTDNAPLANTTNYYRLELGAQGFTSSINIHYVDLGSDGYKVTPNPVATTADIYFNNPNSLEFTLKVMDITGSIVFFAEDIRDDVVEFDRTGLENGYYFFSLDYANETRFSGKIVVN